MDAFDAADYADFFPRKWVRRLATAVLVLAFLFPSQFQRWYLAQAQTHAQHITDELVSTFFPQTELGDTEPTASAVH